MPRSPRTSLALRVETSAARQYSLNEAAALLQALVVGAAAGLLALAVSGVLP